jgi:hypothetical protein
MVFITDLPSRIYYVTEVYWKLKKVMCKLNKYLLALELVSVG